MRCLKNLAGVVNFSITSSGHPFSPVEISMSLQSTCPKTFWKTLTCFTYYKGELHITKGIIVCSVAIRDVWISQKDALVKSRRLNNGKNTDCSNTNICNLTCTTRSNSILQNMLTFTMLITTSRIWIYVLTYHEMLHSVKLLRFDFVVTCNLVYQRSQFKIIRRVEKDVVRSPLSCDI